MFTQDFMLNHIFVRGEVSNCKYHSSGHLYFTLKDALGTIACVMFAGNQRGMTFRLKEGQNVVVEGSVNVYERDGKYQIYAKNITFDGTGVLYQRYEELKKRLEEMGMFAEEYKKPIPKYAKRIGIVTAKTGAAIRDMVTISARRNPYVQLILYPAKVQGDGAKDTIARGIETLDQMELDVIIIGRGGGSIEDLWAFNEECVARAIFNCHTPVISAVGHEVDVTISDYVADLRAPTPSAAAELAVSDYYMIQQRLKEYHYTFIKLLKQKLARYEAFLNQYQIRLRYKSPQNQLLQKRQYLIDIEDKLQLYIKQKKENRKYQLSVLSERLYGLSPLRKLASGYSYISNMQHKAVKSVEQVQEGELIQIQLMDGSLLACVTEKKKETNKE